MRTMHAIRPLPSLAAAALLLAAPVTAQQAAPVGELQEAAWAPLLGCWMPVSQPDETGLVCVRPASDGPGVDLVAVEEGEATVVRTIVADGRARPVAREGCEGTEQAELSPDRRRLYLRADLVCEGGVSRTSTGVISFPSPGQWLDVEAVEVGGQSVAWTQWYREASNEEVRKAGMEGILEGREMAVRSARVAASRPLTAAQVAEAAGRLDAEAVRALVAQRREPFDLDAETLLALDEAGVPGDVIDVMVAVTYPETFVLGGEEAQARPSDRVARRVYMDPYYSPYDPYYYGYRYGRGLYSPWEFWGGYPGYRGGYGPTVVVVEPRSSGHGRVVSGRGYDRGSSASRGTARRGDRAAPAPRRGGSSGASISPSGARSGSGSASSGSTGRRAKPRGGGSGGGGGGDGG